MEKNSTTPGFFIKKEWGKLFERLSNEEIGLIIKNMYRLDDNEDLIEMTLPSEMLFYGSIAPTQEFNREKYERKITANRINGAKGGAPVGNQNARKQENITQNNPNQHKGTVTEKGIVEDISTVEEKGTVEVIGTDMVKEKIIIDNKELPNNKVDLSNNFTSDNVDVFTSNNEKKDVVNISNKINISHNNNSLPPGAMTTAEYFRRQGKL